MSSRSISMMIVALLCMCSTLHSVPHDPIFHQPHRGFTEPAPDARKTLLPASSDTVRAYSFFVGGHLYDASVPHSVELSPTLLNNIGAINAKRATFFISCGDLMGSSGNSFARDNVKAFSAQLSPTLYNAPGNHDVIDREQYYTHFGASTHRFTHGTGKDQFFILDSEDIAETGGAKQFEFLSAYIDGHRNWEAIENIFIFSHRLLWAKNRPEFKEAAQRANVGTGLEFEDAFSEPFFQLLLTQAADKEVYWFAGDVGAPWSYPLFCDTDPDHPNFHYLATGLGHEPEDALLFLQIDSLGQVTMESLGLEGANMNPVEDYNRDWLAQRFEGKPSPDLGRFSDKLRLKFASPQSQTIILLGSALVLVLLAWILFRGTGEE